MKYWFPYHIHTQSLSHTHAHSTHPPNKPLTSLPMSQFLCTVKLIYVWWLHWFITQFLFSPKFLIEQTGMSTHWKMYLTLERHFRRNRGTKVKQYSFLVNKRETLFTRTIYRVHVIHKPWCCPSTSNTLLLTLPSERFVTFHLSEQQMLPFTWRGRSIKIKEWLTFSVTTTTVIKSPLFEHINPAPSWTLPARENNRLTGLCVLVPGLLMTHSSG